MDDDVRFFLRLLLLLLASCLLACLRWQETLYVSIKSQLTPKRKAEEGLLVEILFCVRLFSQQ